MSDDANQKPIKIQLPEGSLEASGSEEWLKKVQAALAFVLGGGVLPLPGAPPPVLGAITNPTPPREPCQVVDVRSLRDQKNPKDVVEMAAIVAYYLAERAPERKETIGAQEITKYFGQAGYATRTKPNSILFRAKNAGYFDSPSQGQYKLNPVGYNLVTAGLPSSKQQRKGAGKRPKISKKPKK
jgi:hypothetical protein